jgi:hypothetical protein
VNKKTVRKAISICQSCPYHSFDQKEKAAMCGKTGKKVAWFHFYETCPKEKEEKESGN